MRTNRELLKELRPPIARFYPYDFHVHSVASADASVGNRFMALPPDFQARLTQLPKVPDDLSQYDKTIGNRVPLDVFYAALRARRDQIIADSGQSTSDNWAFIAVTDHNTAYYSATLSAYAWERRKDDRLIILPGMELEVQFPFPSASSSLCAVHLLCIFPPCTSDGDILLAINKATGTQTHWTFGCPLHVKDLPAFVHRLRLSEHCPALCVAAHVASNKGIESEAKEVVLKPLQAEIARLEGALQRALDDSATADVADLQQQLEILQKKCDPSGLHTEVLRLIGHCGFDALQVAGQTDEVHYRRLHRFLKNSGRATPIACSDAHTPDQVFSCSGDVPYIKLSQPPSELSALEIFSELRDRSLRFGETRTTYARPGRVTHWIDGIEIIPDSPDARRFWNFPPAAGAPPATPDSSFLLPLTPNLNCFVGGRGSGKSAAIEAIAFLTQPKEFVEAAQQKEDRRPEWYGRAVATLRGCQVRLVFKTTAQTGIGGLPKRSLFASRYFDPAGKHSAVELTDADAQKIVDSTIRPPRVNIFRVHEIEQAAQAENLRKLFDALCGDEVAELTENITAIRDALIEQRQKIQTTCQTIADLSTDNSPLRQYAIRQNQFAAVNKPEIKEKYAKVDTAQVVDGETGKIVEAWDTVSASDTLTDLDNSIASFFSSAGAALTQDDGTPKSGLAGIRQVVARPTPEEQGTQEKTIRVPLQQTQQAISAFAQQLAGTKTASAADLESAKGELLQAGLPPGSRDRETKKRAVDEAEQALTQYRAAVATLAQQLKERDTLFQSLVDTCAERTKLRKQTADSLTAQLSQDLDGAILRIEVDAQPMADRSRLDAWLGENIGPVFQRFKAQRLKAILDSGIMPRDLRQILLHDSEARNQVLRIEKERADEGRITQEEADAIVAACEGKRLASLDNHDTILQEVRDVIPEDIRTGVWTFPMRTGKNPCLTMSAVLELDEIILDDLPEIRLNDRPTETASTSRPLSELSPGQRCSAILPVLLLSADTPLIIDQPEENLDNRLIRQVIVNILASMKLRRQVLVATHNPNLPVLGDAEQCVVLQASGRDDAVVIAMGDLDSPKVASFITEIMEGGREAFQYRHTVYQSHWNSVIDETLE